ncbi:Reverse transcriptase zinc-binding domain [Sesbania bispinosa]|nr:Reverse transcriptase zinc-binding domain [Sesbania bispinosa]
MDRVSQPFIANKGKGKIHSANPSQTVDLPQFSGPSSFELRVLTRKKRPRKLHVGPSNKIKIFTDDYYEKVLGNLEGLGRDKSLTHDGKDSTPSTWMPLSNSFDVGGGAQSTMPIKHVEAHQRRLLCRAIKLELRKVIMRVVLLKLRPFEGIWILTNMNKDVTFTIVDSHPQILTVKITAANSSCLCSVVYGSPIPTVHEELWRHLQESYARISDPWFLAGDFNEVLLPSEVRGCNFIHSRAERFSNVIDTCALMNLDVVGGRFFWFRNSQQGTSMAKRLDRVLVNHSWRLAYPEAFTETLPGCFSDHSPLLVRVDGVGRERGQRPFKFLAAWASHPEYASVVEGAWLKSGDSIADKLNDVQVLQDVLSSLCLASGLKVSIDKSRFMCTFAVPRQKKIQFARITGFMAATDLGKRQGESCTWHSILKALDFLREGFITSSIRMQVNEVWDGQQWALDRFHSFLTADFIDILRDQDGLRNSQLHDSWSWDKDHPGAYLVGKAYNWLLHHHRSLQPLDQIWRSVWALQLPEKLRFFVWQCLHDALPINQKRLAFKRSHIAHCPCCSASSESLIHCLRDCPHAKELWLRSDHVNTARFDSHIWFFPPFHFYIFVYYKQFVSDLFSLKIEKPLLVAHTLCSRGVEVYWTTTKPLHIMTNERFHEIAPTLTCYPTKGKLVFVSNSFVDFV